jgi:ribosomal protein S18 acetylase RimI-like enzyme
MESHAPAPMAATPVVVRPMRREDVPRLAASVWDETSPAQIENRWRESEAGFREILVAEVGDRLAGTVSLAERADQPGALHLFALDVGPQWRNRGIGGVLVEHVIAEAARRGLRRIYLEVRVDNPARRLYHRLGFRRVGDSFVNTWWRFEGDGSQTRVDELSYRMVRLITTPAAGGRWRGVQPAQAPQGGERGERAPRS